MNVVIVGRGRVGRGLASALQGTEHPSVLIPGHAFDADAVTKADVIVLAVPDAAIATCAEHIAAVGNRDASILHCAGARGVDELIACRKAGFPVGVMHPLASFSDAPKGPSFEGVAFVIAGDAGAVGSAATIARSIGAVPLTAPIHGPAYHAVASLVANGAAALVNAAVPALEQLGLTRQQSEHALGALLGTVAENVREVGVPRALTGPIMRGDAQTVAAHRAALGESAPLTAQAYEAVVPLILRCATDLGLSSAQAQAIARALE
ncbi:MAG: DUF2520 domain-containing protein [Proteobacteria bacterium]|nr:MAG: DUF2520 domain-containing protein [Pseudomonadota bacterium]